MRIAIVGAGIVGIATAHELARDGHQVTVFERRGAAAEEASFSSSGVLAPSLLIPLATPVMDTGHRPLLWGARASMRLARGAGLAELRWLWRWRKAGRSPLKTVTVKALEQLGRYSQAVTSERVHALKVDIETSHGALVLLRNGRDQKQMQTATQWLKEAGTAAHEVDSETARQIEPGLSADIPLAGAIHVPDGESGNCRLFALVLRQASQDLGVQFEFNATVEAVGTSPAGVRLKNEKEMRPFDAVVLCAGLTSARLMRPLGLRLPMAPVYGYTISAPLREDTHAPQGTVIDPLHHVTITRQGQRVRVSGGAELGHGGGEHHAQTLQTLYLSLAGWFPGGVQLSSSHVQVWRGARPTLPDGAPVIGPSGTPHIWLNTGHGAGGWALACGSARVLADQLAQRVPAIDLQAFSAQRF